MKIFLKETIISVILSLLFIFLLSLIISKTALSENVIIPTIIGISAISIMIVSIRVSKTKKEKGIINGAIVGLLYMGTMYVFSSIILKDFSLTINSIIMIFAGILGGVLGGIIGVNF